jgi:hypothetical protein
MALEQPKGDGATEGVDHEIDVGVGPKLAAVYRAFQNQARHIPPTIGELRQECPARRRVELRLGNQSDERRAGHGSRLQTHDRLRDVLEIARDVSRVGVVQLAAGDVEVQVHAQRGLGRPLAIQWSRHAAFGRHALHRQLRVAVAAEDPRRSREHAFLVFVARNLNPVRRAAADYRLHPVTLRYVGCGTHLRSAVKASWTTVRPYPPRRP